MSGHRYTPAEYTLHRIVKSLGNLLFQFEEAHSTHTYWLILHFCQLEKINYLVLRYLNTCVLPFEEFSEDSLFDDEGWSLSIWGMATGDVSNWQLLQGEGKRSSFGKKQRDKEKTR